MEIEEVIESTSPNMRSMLETVFPFGEERKIKERSFNLLLCLLKLFENYQTERRLIFDASDMDCISMYFDANGTEVKCKWRNFSYGEKPFLVLIGSLFVSAKLDRLHKISKIDDFKEKVAKTDKLIYVDFLQKDPERHARIYSSDVYSIIKNSCWFGSVFDLENDCVKFRYIPREIRIRNYVIGPSEYTIKRGLLDNVLSQINID